MTRAGITVTAREVAWISMTSTLLLMGAWIGIGISELRTEIRGMRRDICQYAVPDAARRFAESCRDMPSTGLMAQSPR